MLNFEDLLRAELEKLKNSVDKHDDNIGDKVKFWEDNDYSLLDLELEEVQHFCNTVILARDVLVKYPGFDGAMMLAKLGVLDGFDD